MTERDYPPIVGAPMALEVAHLPDDQRGDLPPGIPASNKLIRLWHTYETMPQHTSFKKSRWMLRELNEVGIFLLLGCC